MKNKNKILTIVVVCVLFLLVGSFILLKKLDKKEEKEHVKMPTKYEFVLADDILSHIDGAYEGSPLANNGFNNMVFGITTEDAEYTDDNPIGETKGVYSYNLNTKETIWKKKDIYEKIGPYLEFNDKAYYVKKVNVEVDGVTYFHWQLFIADLDLQNEKLLKEGKNFLFNNNPELYVDSEQNKLYFFDTNDVVEKKTRELITQQSTLYRVENDNLIAVYENKYDRNNKNDYYVRENYSNCIRNNIFYVALYGDVEKIFQIDLEKNEKTVIYDDKQEEYKLFSFKVLDDALVVVAINKDDNSKLSVYKDSKIIYEEDIWQIANLFQVANNKVLIKQMNTSKIYNSTFNKIFDIDIPESLKNARFLSVSFNNKTVAYSDSEYLVELKEVY